MAPSEALTESVPDALPSASPAIEDRGRTIDSKADGNGHLDGSFDQHALLRALQAMRLGNFSVRLPGDQTGLSGKIADTFNEIVAANARMAHQLERVGHVVGREGKTRQRVRFGLSDGAWGEMETSVNTCAPRQTLSAAAAGGFDRNAARAAASDRTAPDGGWRAVTPVARGPVVLV